MFQSLHLKPAGICFRSIKFDRTFKRTTATFHSTANITSFPVPEIIEIPNYGCKNKRIDIQSSKALLPPRECKAQRRRYLRRICLLHNSNISSTRTLYTLTHESARMTVMWNIHPLTPLPILHGIKPASSLLKGYARKRDGDKANTIVLRIMSLGALRRHSTRSAFLTDQV